MSKFFKTAKQSLTDEQHADILTSSAAGAGTLGAKVNTLMKHWNTPFGKITGKSLVKSGLKGFGIGALVGIGAGATLVAMDKKAGYKSKKAKSKKAKAVFNRIQRRYK